MGDITPEERAGQTDLFEALGLEAEEQGDAANRSAEKKRRQFSSQRRSARAAKILEQQAQNEAARAIRKWRKALNYYQRGLRIGRTAFLAEGAVRVREKLGLPPKP